MNIKASEDVKLKKHFKRRDELIMLVIPSYLKRSFLKKDRKLLIVLFSLVMSCLSLITISTFVQANTAIENIALNKSYTSSLVANNNYPDSGIKLTDGIYGTTEPGDVAWQARLTAENYYFIIDLEQESAMEAIKANFLQRPDSGISLPEKVHYYASDDNQTFNKLAEVYQSDAEKLTINPYDASIYSSQFVLDNLNDVSARFIKIEVEGNGWTFIDEVEILGEVKEPGVSAPQELQATNGPNSTVYLSWTPSAEDQLYRIYKDNVLIDETTETDYLVEGLTPGTMYSFFITALNEQNVESESSNTVFITPVPAGDQGDHPVFKGTFLQPDLADSWTDAEWDNEFHYMSNVGVNQLFLQWVADSKGFTAVYDTDVAGFTQNTSKDLVGKALEKAEKYHSEIYIGLVLNEDWFIKYANDQAWLDNEADIVKSFVDEIWERYGEHEAFTGWYLSFEVDNWNLPTETEWNRLATYYLEVIDHIKSYSPDKPVVISPFFNPNGGLDSNEWKDMWTYILNIVPIDIIALQDGVGAGHATVSTLPEWFEATRDAIDIAQTHTQLWSDTETFTLDFEPMDIAKIVKHMKAVQPYVSHYISFSFNHYLSPQQVDPLYFETYENYVATGDVDDVSPSVPQSMDAEVQSSSAIKLMWTSSTDNVGVTGYHIYRDNNKIQTLYGAETTFTDILLDSETSYSYSVQAFDAAGNTSERTNESTATTLPREVYNNNYALNKYYTSSIPAHANYPDNGVKLTDGVFGGFAYENPAWQARHTEKEFEFVVDLGTVKEIKEISANFLQDKDLYIFLPRHVTFDVSYDNENFIEVGSVPRPAVGDGNLAKSYFLTELADVSGRYVKVKVKPATAWTFIDEIEVYGDN